MTRRWICSRCYTSADETASRCPNCGTPKGASAVFTVPGAEPPPNRTTTPPAPVEPTVPGGSAAPVASAAETTAHAADPASPEPATPPVRPESAIPSTGLSSERWVCLRCFASNDGNATTCATCGTARGAESGAEPDGSGAWTAPAAPVPAGSGGRRFPWQYVLYGVIGLVAVGSTLFFAARRGDEGAITGAGDLSVQDLRVGDCFDFTDDSTEVTSVRAIPCAEPHIYEIYFVADYPAGEEPSDISEPYTQWENDSCVNGFEPYVAHDFDTSIWYISTLTPTPESWDAGDRSIQCFLHNETETVVTGSAQGSAR